MAGKENKKNRGKTFIREENELLLRLVKKHFKTIENKKSDVVTWKEKQEKWATLADEFNSVGLYENRTRAQLQNKWMQCKKIARREYGAERSALIATGGGEYKPPKVSEFSRQVHQLCAETIEGDTNPFDCDAKANTLIGAESFSTPIAVASCSTSVGVAGCSSNISEVTESSDYPSGSQFLDDDDSHEIHELLQLEHIDLEFAADMQNEIPGTPKTTWASYKPSQLKTAKHPALATPSTGKKSTNTNTKGVVKNHAEMVQAKKDVIKIQGEYFKKLIEVQELEKNIIIEKHKWAKEEHDVRMKILEAELKNTKQ